MKMKHTFSLYLTAFTLGLCLGVPVQSAGFPEKAIKLIVPWDAGGGTDVIARGLARSGEKHLGVPVVVENKPGGTGAVGLAEVLRAKPDGYTVAILPVELGFLKETGIYPFSFNDFTTIMNLNTDAAALTVKTGRFRTAQEFIDFAKTNPKKLKVGHSGTGMLWHLAAAALAQKADIELTFVPFNGAATAMAALMGEQIDAVTVSGAEVSSQVRAGELTILAGMGDKRMSFFPDVPTLMEMGIDVNINTFRGLGGPKGIQADRVKILAEGFHKMMDDPAFTETMGKLGLGIDYRDTEEYRKLAEETAKTLQPVIKAIGLERKQ